MRWVVLLVAACGRIGFGAFGDAQTSSDASDAAMTPNYAFVTSMPMLTDIASADAACNTNAAAAGLAGTYVAWLSTAATPAPDRLGSARGWIRPDGKPVVDTVADLQAGRMYYPIDVDEHGNAQVSALVTTGTQWSSGAYVAASNDCIDFTSTSGSDFAAEGRAAGTTALFSNAFATTPCGRSGFVYCFGIDRAAMVSVAPTSGRLAFATHGLWPVSGIAAADAFCTSEAAAAGHAGSFLAFLATTTVPGESRMNLAGANWVRADGLPLAASPNQVFNPGPDVPITLDASGAIATSPFFVNWVGNTSNDCNAWQDTTSNMFGEVAYRVAGPSAFNLGGGQGCNGTFNLLCFEQ
jgi:hypothetical protein